MTKEQLLKLLQSKVHEDNLIGLNYLSNKFTTYGDFYDTLKRFLEYNPYYQDSTGKYISVQDIYFESNSRLRKEYYNEIELI